MIHFKIIDNLGTWWGAWLNVHQGRRIFSPSQRFGFEYRRLSTQNLFPPEVEVIPCHLDAKSFLHGIGRMDAKRLGFIKR